VNVNDLQLVKADSLILRATCLAITPEMCMPVLHPYYASIADRMVEIVRESNALGLAAPQIGIPIRMIVVHLKSVALVMVNPEIDAIFGEMEKGNESCLSLPGVLVPVTRNEGINVRFITRDGFEKATTVTRLAARVVMHEIDHLDGVLITDHE